MVEENAQKLGLILIERHHTKNIIGINVSFESGYSAKEVSEMQKEEQHNNSLLIVERKVPFVFY